MKTVTLVAKGPSAVHAQAWIDRMRTDVAVINEAGLLLRETQPIHFGFFSHQEMAMRMRSLWNRIEIFSGPESLTFADGSIERVRDVMPADFPLDRFRGYPDWKCCGYEASLLDRIRRGGICHHHTTTGAHHWLVRQGYRRVRVIGVDGGTGYATGMNGLPGPWSLDEWKTIHMRLAALLKRGYGAITEWYR